MDRWTGVILAGGLGTRLRPLTQEIPKPLVQVANKPMLDYAIDHLKYAGIKKIIIVLKHMSDKIREHMEKEWFQNPENLQDLEIQIPNVDSRDTADALRKVSDLIETENIIVSMGDIVTNLPLKEFLDYHLSKKGIATISMKEIDEPKQYGVVILDESRKIHVFLEKPTSHELYLSSFLVKSNETYARNLINTGIYAFNKEIMDILERESGLMDFGKNVFPYLLENYYEIYGFVGKYYWMDVGQPKPYLWANWDLLRGYGWPITPRGEDHDGIWYEEEPPRIDDESLIEKPCAFGTGVNVGKHSKIKTLCVINNNVSIGDFCEIERSTIWNDVKIGENSRIFESILCNDVTIGDNVILENCVVGPGSIINSDKTLKYEKIVKRKNDDSPIS
ncbi:MAG: sugar phosphate nucleotidyltransferase [Promethearchaeota archaeon]